MRMEAVDYMAYKLLHDGALALARAERAGIRVDVKKAQELADNLTHEIQRLESEFRATKFYKHWSYIFNPPNIYSDYQLAHILYKVRKIEPPKLTKSGRGSTDEETLLMLGMPILEKLIKIRKLKKVRDTYLSSFIRETVDGYMHPFYNLHTVTTFRSSSDSPNFQNIPKRDKEAMKLCRSVLLPHKGHRLLELDYSGIEVKISACYHKDPTMIDYINDPSSDMHADMAMELFLLPEEARKWSGFKMLRSAAKNGFVFPQFYGDWFKGCAYSLAVRWGKLPKEGNWRKGQGIEIDEGKHLADHLISKGITNFDAYVNHVEKIENHFWKERFKVYDEWKDKWWQDYLKNGYFYMHTGFRCIGVMSRKDVCNYPIQGSAFHCLLWTFIEVDREMQRRKMESRLIGQIHDAIVMSVHPKEVDDVIELVNHIGCERIREEWPWIIVPLEMEGEIGEVDAPWSEIKEIEITI